MILRVKKTRLFSVVANEPFNDSRLSYKARGILGYLLTKPDDWEILVEDLINQSEKDGRDSVRAGLAELREYGYLVLADRRDARGRMLGKGYVLYETPEEADLSAPVIVPDGPGMEEAPEMEQGELFDPAQPTDGFSGDRSTDGRVFRRSGFPSDGKTPPTKYLYKLNTELYQAHTQIAREKEIFGEKYAGLSGVALQNAVKRDAVAWLKSDPLGVETWAMMCDPFGYKSGPEAVVAEWVPKQPDQKLREWVWHINTAASYLANIVKRSTARPGGQAQAPAAPAAPSGKFKPQEITRAMPKI